MQVRGPAIVEVAPSSELGGVLAERRNGSSPVHAVESVGQVHLQHEGLGVLLQHAAELANYMLSCSPHTHAELERCKPGGEP